MIDKTLTECIRALCAPLEPRATDVEPQLTPLPGIKAVLFDVYGTLLISASGDIGLDGERTAAISLDELLSAAGIDRDQGQPAPSLGPAQPPADFQAQRQRSIRARLSAEIQANHAASRAAGITYPEVDIRTIWNSVLAELGVRPTAQQLQRIALEYECRVNPVWPMPGLADVIAHLRQRRLVLGIVSNAQFYTPLILEVLLGQPPAALGLDPDCSAWSYQLGAAKPSTSIYQVALAGLADRHGIRPEQVLYIGNDRRNDIWPAQQLGLHTALFAGDARSLRLRADDPSLDGVSANRVLTALDQIPQLIA